MKKSFFIISLLLTSSMFMLLHAADTLRVDAGRAKIYDYTMESGDYYITTVGTGTYRVKLDLRCRSLIGTHSSSVVDSRYTRLYDTAGREIMVDSVSRVVVSQDEDTTRMEAYMHSSNKVYAVRMSEYPLTATRTVTIQGTAAMRTPAETGIGVLLIQGTSSDGRYGVSVGVYADQVEGDYTEYDQYIDDDNNTWTYVAELSQSPVAYHPFDAEFAVRVQYQQDGTLLVRLQGIGMDAVYYDATLTVPATAIEENRVAAPATKVLRRGQVLIEKNGILYTQQGQIVE